MSELTQISVKDLTLADPKTGASSTIPNENDEWTVIENTEDGDGEILTVGDILDTLSEDAFREYYILSRCLLHDKTKSAKKLLHHMNKFKLNEMQLFAVEAGLVAVEAERDRREKNGS